MLHNGEGIGPNLQSQAARLDGSHPHRIKVPISGYSLGLRRAELQYPPPAQTPDVERRLTGDLGLNGTQGEVVQDPLPPEALAKILDRGKATAVRRADALVAQRVAKTTKLVEAKKRREPLLRATGIVGARTVKNGDAVEVVPKIGRIVFKSPNRKPSIGEGRRAIEVS